MTSESQLLTQERVDAAFDLAERQEWEIMARAGRAELACATVAMCSAYLGMLRRHHESVERGELMMDLAGRGRMVREHYNPDFQDFFFAWHRGGTAAENLRVVEVAVHGFAQEFGSDDQTRDAGERMLLDFMRHAVRRLPARGSSFSDPVVASLGGAPGGSFGCLRGRGW